MSMQAELERYLAHFRQRLATLIAARAAAALALGALTLTLIAVYFGTRRAFDPDFVFGARLVLVLGLSVLALAFWWKPLRALKRSRGVPDIEQRSPEFDGRVETYQAMADGRAVASPFFGLLAEDTLRIARSVPAALKVRPWEISLPGAIAAIAAVALIGFAAFGPGNWRYGIRHLWAGWAVSGMLPPQSIEVEPGDGAVRRGGDLVVAAAVQGFDPERVEIYARFDSSTAWQTAAMQREGDRYGFTFFALREPLRYYVAAAGIRSPEYRVEVVDLPRIENLRLTYHYPAWTGLEPRTEEPGTDIRAVAGTDVLVELRTDRPLIAPALVANGESIALVQADGMSRGTLPVTENGEYYLTTQFNGEPVKLSDDYLISVIPDGKPSVKLVKPGRDWRASSIEEVTIAAEASDDFALERVQLHYAVNGGDWTIVDLPADGKHIQGAEILYLEELRKPAPVAVTRPRRDRMLEFGLSPEFSFGADPEPETQPAASEQRGEPVPLEPGDLISYYVVAEDREQSVRTDLYFVEVQPFSRSYSQSMQGGGGGGGGGEQDEISRRQKELLVATWNLIREQQEQSSFLDEQQIRDNALMLAELQRTLADQARTVASRTRARQLTSASEDIQTFVRSLEQAAEAMGPAAERLANLNLQEAVPSEQEALQHLLRAEAVFTDIQVAMQRGGGGGGGLAGRDLAELFELEMDMEKNQYESEAPVAFDAPASNDMDEAIAKLQELARRQEALAREAERRNTLGERERWQQEMLRRETEELKRQLEQLERQAANQQQGQSGDQGQQGQEGQQGQQGQSSQQAQSQGAAGGGAQGQTGEAIRQLEAALEAMNRAGGQGGQGMDPEQARRAIEQARRQLGEALSQMTAQRQAAAQEAYSDLAERSRSLHEQQRQVAAELQSALRQALEAGTAAEAFRRGMLDPEAAATLAETKDEMRAALEALEQDMQRVAQQFRAQTPGASSALNQAISELQQSQAVARLGYAAESIRRGSAPQVAATEGVTTSALRNLQTATEAALAQAAQEAVAGQAPEINPNAELVAELQALRRALAEYGPGSRQGAGSREDERGEPTSGAAPGSEPADGSSAANEGPPGAATAGGQRYGGGPGGGYYDPRAGGVWDPLNADNAFDVNRVGELEERLSAAGRDLLTLGTRLRSEGLSDADLDAVRALGDALRRGLRGNPELVATEYRALMDLAEKLELQLRDSVGNAGSATVRADAPTQPVRGYEEPIAEYYRRLSRAER